MKQLHVCLRVLQYYATVATERAGYVLYRSRALVYNGLANSDKANILNTYFHDCFNQNVAICLNA